MFFSIAPKTKRELVHVNFSNQRFIVLGRLGNNMKRMMFTQALTENSLAFSI